MRRLEALSDKDIDFGITVNKDYLKTFKDSENGRREKWQEILKEWEEEKEFRNK